MRVMAIDTADSFMEHFALNIRAIDIYFVINLPIHMVSWNLHIRRPWLNHLRKEMIEKRIVGMMPGMYKTTTGMAFCTGFDLRNIAAIDIGKPKMGKTFPTLVCPSHFNMFSARTVT